MNTPETKTKLVVFNEHTLGYIMPELPKYVQVLHASILKGAPFEMHPSSKLINKNDEVRLASEKDFESFRCVFGSFGNKEEYIYEA